MKAFLQRYLGPPTNAVGLGEKLVATVGGMLAILCVYGVSLALLAPAAGMWVVASMGASAVLLFGVPHGPLSQPWPLFGGHLVSALVGVSCARWIPDPGLAAACAVGLALGAMHLLRCVHPPGGATALTAVLGGPAIAALGYGFVMAPVMLNVSLIFLVAVLFNWPFAWRRYPVGLMHYEEAPGRPDAWALDRALHDMNIIVDISPDELRRIVALAQQHAGEAEGVLELGRRGIAVNDVEVRKHHGVASQAEGPSCRVRLQLVPDAVQPRRGASRETLGPKPARPVLRACSGGRESHCDGENGRNDG